MNLKLLTLVVVGMFVPSVVFAQKGGGGYSQDGNSMSMEGIVNRKRGNSSSSTGVSKFNNRTRAFRDWAISLGGGTSFMHSADLTSFYDAKVTPGYNVYVSLDKQVTHAFGFSLQYQTGKTIQRGSLKSVNGGVMYPNGVRYTGQGGETISHTRYDQLSLLGDLNLSGLFRRMDNFSTYRWALHAYAGIGVQGFVAYGIHGSQRSRYSVFEAKRESDFLPFFYQGGLGLKFNLGKLLDLELRTMYIISGDDEFDRGDNTMREWSAYNMIKKNNSDNMLTVNLGVSFKLGEKENKNHLAWYDPMKELYLRVEKIRKPRTTICVNGDRDNDGVCDDWDRQLDTPVGARVDGAGVALDMDLDGIIDLYDRCVTIPGPVENSGCPQHEK